MAKVTTGGKDASTPTAAFAQETLPQPHRVTQTSESDRALLEVSVSLWESPGPEQSRLTQHSRIWHPVTETGSDFRIPVHSLGKPLV